MAMQIYSNEVLREKIIALDTVLDEGYEKGRMDTQLNEQEWQMKLSEMRLQRDRYFKMLQDQLKDPSGGRNLYLLPASRWIA